MAAVLLAVCLNPAASALRELVQTLYPIGPETLDLLGELSKLMVDAPMWQVVALMALTPAICEELAFRGFILSGLRHLGHKGMAILVCSLFFGIVHGMLQQSINACILGMVLGSLAVQTGSLLPCVLFHATHNALQIVGSSALTTEFLQRHPGLDLFLVESPSLPGNVDVSPADRDRQCAGRRLVAAVVLVTSLYTDARRAIAGCLGSPVRAGSLVRFSCLQTRCPAVRGGWAGARSRCRSDPETA